MSQTSHHIDNLSPSEKRDLLALLLEKTILAEPRQELVTSTFAAWAKRTPEHSAVSQGREVWTYGELAERAYALAGSLRAKGLAPGDVVAVCGQQSFGLIASMMGVLLSGGVLLPIDRCLPSQRKQFMLREAAATTVLYVGSQESKESWLEDDSTLDFLRVHSATGRAVDTGAYANLETTPLPKLSPDDPAYIFFTSGTTGAPRGILGCHKGLSHFLSWQRQTFAIGPEDRSAQLTGLSFDVVLRDIFTPLTSGATLCLPEDIDSLGPDGIICWLEQEQISVLHTVPSLTEFWLAHVPARVSLGAMRWVFIAGEPLTDTLVRQWRSVFPDSGNIVNLYGPTETTLAKCFYSVPDDALPGIQPVGSPLPQTQVLVLAENSQLCGIGEPGEIVLRTPFRSLGYINAPEENRKRFVKNPFREDEEDRLYYTGDRGRYRLDGTLEILGRIDDQVKIRGMRVEPSEVTATLAQHPLVKSCFVAARQDNQGQPSLVAYVVALTPNSSLISQLRFYLSQHLPQAMVPSTFVFLERLPLTPNGKVDRHALPGPSQIGQAPQAFLVAPQDELELQLTKIWGQILGIQPVGVHDSFFELGGNSLLATQVISRVLNTFGIQLSLRLFFGSPTVADMARMITRNEGIQKSSRIDITARGNEEQLLAKIDKLSDQELEMLLKDMLAEEETANERYIPENRQSVAVRKA